MRSTLKSLAYSSIRSLRGYPGWLKDFGWYGQKARMRQATLTLGIDTVIDVGANDGQFATELRLIGFAGELHSFEPNPEVFQSLARRAAGDALWHCHNLALGREPGELELNLMESSVYGSFLAPSANSDALQIEGNKVVKKAKVPVETMEHYLGAKGFDVTKKRLFLKTDTQGFDLEVLSGAGAIFRGAALVQLEMSCDPIYESMPSMAKAMEFVQSAGFKVLDLFPVTRKGILGHVVEYDALLIRGDLANSAVRTLS